MDFLTFYLLFLVNYTNLRFIIVPLGTSDKIGLDISDLLNDLFVTFFFFFCYLYPSLI
jgi:hypothetical protein